MIIPRVLLSTLELVESLRLEKANLPSGQVYEERLGPDLKSGKVYLRQFGPDNYVGTVDGEGRMHRHVPLAPDEYIGVIDPFVSLAHAGAALLLLVLPALEEAPAHQED